MALSDGVKVKNEMIDEEINYKLKFPLMFLLICLLNSHVSRTQ